MSTEDDTLTDHQLAYLIFSGRPEKPLDAAQAAYIFDCDVDALSDSYSEHLAQSEEWSAAAMRARDSGDEVGAEACLHEARAWASDANLLRDAVALCHEHRLAGSTFGVWDYVRRYRQASAQRWHEVHLVKDRLGLAQPWPDLECRCDDVCCAVECCEGDRCECCEGVLVEFFTCAVCGQERPAVPVPLGTDESAVEGNPVVASAIQNQSAKHDEMWAAFDSAFGRWAREVGLR